ncbi:phage virion morphogenesis protein [Xanthomonas campestris pv. campestris]|uniref:phage virion morphogenesis protein n=1 Tax=Xanthomonas campestris TaxID=339 RepID=UPI002AD39B6B|nr:phage virion morphogenesis protein [Xanthomonas campestris]MEA0694254.1 phage virion morphogenesis protein [Xanthomonas campestris pv. campestris]MEA0831827.1 phage virion morphogenesis protein [Xanthomonas campestris pv. campestris]MEA9951177.1 phage virion morphogenesis protein [Xanthomonas campestris pv. raphani]MEB1092795.1 phage virion morphogenesis protein [Xanthomonas campestris pv. campestris]MEB1329061.1 phage virion morphogenesis protein [Xanthomonas campestris pv. campestris]
MDELTALENWAAPLLARLQPGERRTLARKIGTELRRSQSQRIGKQQAPDGTPYAPRKQQLRQKSGRVKRAKMFAKLRQAKFFKVSASPNQVSVGFVGRVSRIARVHQEGLTERVRKNGPNARYEKRVLLGLTELDRRNIMDLLITFFPQ